MVLAGDDKDCDKFVLRLGDEDLGWAENSSIARRQQVVTERVVAVEQKGVSKVDKSLLGVLPGSQG